MVIGSFEVLRDLSGSGHLHGTISPNTLLQDLRRMTGPRRAPAGMGTRAARVRLWIHMSMEHKHTESSRLPHKGIVLHELVEPALPNSLGGSTQVIVPCFARASVPAQRRVRSSRVASRTDRAQASMESLLPNIQFWRGEPDPQRLSSNIIHHSHLSLPVVL